VDPKEYPRLYRFLRSILRMVYPKCTIHGLENLPDEPCIIASNHTKANGPIICELYFPGRRYLWCIGEMMNKKEVPEYAFNDFWSKKPHWSHPFYRLCARLIAPIAEYIFVSGKGIPVYHDARLLSTFRESIRRLQEGGNLIIFPEHEVIHNHIVWEFQDKFVDTARLYYRKTGKELSFVPMYIAPSLHGAYVGKPIRFDSSAPIELERRRICDYLMDSITDTALSLPEHIVVPYPNMPKRCYGKNTDPEVPSREKTRR